MSNLRKLLNEMVQIEEAFTPYTDYEDVSTYDDDIEANHSLDGEDDSPKASEIGLSKDFPDLGEGEEDAFVPDDIQISQDDDAFVPDDIQLKEYGADIRQMTNKLHEYMDDGMLDPRVVADAALKYMSEDDVADMAHANQLIWDDDDDDEELGDDGYADTGEWNEGLGEDPWGLG